jgi:serine/threonine protein kinase
MLDDIKDHCTSDIVFIGAGSYCEAFKFYYDREACPHLKTNENTECLQCKIYTESGKYVIKEIQKNYRYTQSDFDSEVNNQKYAIEYMPELIVNIYEYWNEIFETGPAGTITDKLGERDKSNKTTVLEAYGYITMEYMNYKDLYFNYKSGKPGVKWAKPINIRGLLLICLIILYNLHCKLGICHGDFRDTNIFLKYIGSDYKQKVKVSLDSVREFDVDTGGFHIKLGDFGLAESIVPDTKSFIFRDYEFLENLYKNSSCWRWMTASKKEYTTITKFIFERFMIPINKYMFSKNYGPENTKSRKDFWYSKHIIPENSPYLYTYPKLLLESYISEFYSQ